MMGDPLIGLAGILIGGLVVAAVVGFLLFQFSFAAIWCLGNHRRRSIAVLRA
jgi:hypothetical protein